MPTHERRALERGPLHGVAELLRLHEGGVRAGVSPARALVLGALVIPAGGEHEEEREQWEEQKGHGVRW